MKKQISKFLVPSSQTNIAAFKARVNYSVIFFTAVAIHYQRNNAAVFQHYQAPCKRTQHCWMFHVVSICMSLLVVRSCCGETFEPTPSISFVP